MCSSDLFSLRPFGYTSYFSMHEFGYLGIGMSAANMAYELAVHGGFKNVILIGQDLAFGEDGTSHAVDAIYGKNEIDPKPAEDKIMIEKYGGGGEVETTQVWKLFLTFFEKDIYDTKNRIRVVNSTEGGARIHGAEEIAFSESIKIIDKTKKKEPLTLTCPTKKEASERLESAREKVEELLRYGKEKKEEVEAIFLKLAKMLEKIEELNSKGDLEGIDFEKIDFMIEKIEEVKKLFFDAKFINIFVDATQSYIFHQELDIAKIISRWSEDEMQKKAKKIEWLYAHRYWLFSLAGGMGALLERVEVAYSGWESKSSNQKSKTK